jgi:hypothetical protein
MSMRTGPVECRAVTCSTYRGAILILQADFTNPEEAAAKKASRATKKYSYRGVELDQLLDLSNEDFIGVGHHLSTGCGDVWGMIWDS